MTESAQARRTENVAVSTTSLQISPRRDDRSDLRRQFVLRNNSPNAIDIITIELGENLAVAGTGAIILLQGQPYGEADGEGFECHKGAISAVCATVNGVLGVMEK